MSCAFVVLGIVGAIFAPSSDRILSAGAILFFGAGIPLSLQKLARHRDDLTEAPGVIRFGDAAWPAFTFRMDRQSRMLFALGAFCFGGGSVAFAIASGEDDIVLTVVGVLGGLLGFSALSLILTGVEQAISLIHDGLVLRGAGISVFVSWDSLKLVDYRVVWGRDMLAFDFSQAQTTGTGWGKGLQALNRKLTKRDFSIAVDQLSASPGFIEAVIGRYRTHPEFRSEIGQATAWTTVLESLQTD
ncbi:MAG: hypothetical protein ABR600_10990 [Actinomycetota bacterium]